MPTRSSAARLAACAAVILVAFAAAIGPATAAPLAWTLRTIDNDAGVRLVIEFSRKPFYEVRGDARRIYISMREGDVQPAFKKKDYDGPLLERIKFVEGMRTAEIVLYTGPEFGTFSTFEMGEPFRLVVDLRRRAALPPATRLDTPGTPPAGGAVAPGAHPGSIPPAGAAGEAPVPAPPPAGAAPTPPAASGGVAPPIPDAAAFTIVIDAGHGGEEEGARGPTGLLEKDVTLDIAKRLRDRLKGENGVEVLMTRDDDRRVPLDDRTALANHARADLFVSIHANSSRRDNAMGSETYFLSYQATDDETRAVAALENNRGQLDSGVPGTTGLDLVLWDLAQSAFLKESSDLAETIQDRLNDTLGVRNRGIKQAPFRVLMGATMPAVLVEVAFISSAEEEKRLRDAAFKDRIADAIAASIRNFRKRVAR
ncbi:MAG TPA: N-acetylmuramoyl-L-alanine amidase [Dongiaceae bacterium]|nr:N-acetylmuramoyl-L-alanine amidase [Dongiaceae bacterium]